MSSGSVRDNFGAVAEKGLPGAEAGDALPGAGDALAGAGNALPGAGDALSGAGDALSGAGAEAGAVSQNRALSLRAAAPGAVRLGVLGTL